MWKTVSKALVGGAFFLAVALAAALVLGRRLSHGILSLGDPIRALSHGEVPKASADSNVAEIADLGREADQAAMLLHLQSTERQTAERELQTRIQQQQSV